MGKYRSGGEGSLQGFKRLPGIIGEVPCYTLPGETGQRNDNVGIVGNEPAVEVSEAKEGLNVLHFSGFGPVLDSLDFRLIHLQSFFGKDEAEVLNGVLGEVTFVRTGEKAVFMETTEDLTDMFGVFHRVIGID